MPSDKYLNRFLFVASLLIISLFFLFCLLPGKSEAQAVQEALIGTYSQSPTQPAVPNPMVEAYRPNTSFGPVVAFPRTEGLPVDWSEIRRERLEELAAEAATRIHFDFDSAELGEDGGTTEGLDHLAALLKGNPDVGLLLTGHADKAGPEDYNLALGERRARSVMMAVAERGVDSSRLLIDSRGEDEPALLVVEPERENRRVEVGLFDLFAQ
ncbi:MAG: OmpA family protein [Candidatus Altiarchaeales archaeon]|nr:OmpA family protein [Candidatus Altiarchaeales archaeon]